MGKVLVVDDTKNIRMMLTTCLEIEGYDVIQCKNGYEALEVFEKEELELAFIDIKMPEVSGTELLKKIRVQNINTPVIIMTAFATVKNAIDCTKLGAVAYLQKPFTTDKIKAILKESTFKVEKSQYHIKMAEEFLEQGKLEEATNILKKYLSIEPSNGKIYYLIGKAYEREGNVNEALKFFKVSEVFGYECSDKRG
ncbi:response regulator [Clostridium sp. MSJ-4]|uniref:Response regulator n=1 Tax=Clostridium simiarum TaxID=2841506 RepID=A0ABS6F3E1_9CLOT|nr:tetratricopeptide repeat protein [Clostridium simiarum]MBU5592389.1 response regulator [Clostridium simiarum]